MFEKQHINLHTTLYYKEAVTEEYFDHTSAKHVNTLTVIQRKIETTHPGKRIFIVGQYGCNLIAHASRGGALCIEDPKYNATEFGSLTITQFVPPKRRLDGQRGVLASEIVCGKYKYAYDQTEFILYIVDGRDGTESYPQLPLQYLVCPSSDGEVASKLLYEVGAYDSELHDEVWVFNQGWWQKDASLWQSVQRASWDAVILEPSMKKALINDVTRFFDSRATYERLKVPWKRGIIYYGPPGNGKTSAVKAMMHMLYSRRQPIPTLYVKTLSSFGGPEASLSTIFAKARREAPCYLVFEDLDSVVTDGVRSFFLNEVDGLSSNDGILMIGSTNHLDRLDPGISKRPSRFDRKYLFPNPSIDERTLYAEFWGRKLKDGDKNDNIEFPDALPRAFAEITRGFSFAYMQEAFVAALLVIAGKSQEELQQGFSTLQVDSVVIEDAYGEYYADSGLTVDTSRFADLDPSYTQTSGLDKIRGGKDADDLDKYVLWRELKRQVKNLRDEIKAGDNESLRDQGFKRREKCSFQSCKRFSEVHERCLRRD